MQAEKRRAQIGLVSAVLVLAVSLAVLMKQGAGESTGATVAVGNPSQGLPSPAAITLSTESHPGDSSISR